MKHVPAGRDPQAGLTHLKVVIMSILVNLALKIESSAVRSLSTDSEKPKSDTKLAQTPFSAPGPRISIAFYFYALLPLTLFY